MWTHLSEESLVKANAQFWEQMLNMEMEIIPHAERFCVGAGQMRASVNLAGAWAGRIEIRLSESLAHAATAAMMMQAVESVSKEDTLDAIREIANMIGGVIKSSLPRPCTMTLPESSVTGDQLCNDPHTKATMTMAFRHAAGGLVLKVWEEEPEQGADGTVEQPHERSEDLQEA